MKKLLLSLLAVFLLLEEWLWDVLTAASHRLVLWLRLQAFERWLAQASPKVAMATLVLPMVLILPVKLAALWLFTHGQFIQGIGLLIAAKLFATLLVSRMFAIAKPQLLTFKWFALVYTTLRRWLDWAHERVRETAAYQQLIRLKQAAKIKWLQWLGRQQ